MSGRTPEAAATRAAAGSADGGGALRLGEADLIGKAIAGDCAAFAQIALAWQDRIYNTLLRMTGNAEDAADLTQETLLKAMSHLGGFRGGSSVQTWLFRIAMNLATSRLRQLRRRRTIVAGQLAGRGEDQEAPDVLDEKVNPTPSPDTTAEKRERDREVMDALRRLPEDQRSLLVLRDVDGMDYQQIAEILSVPLGTLKSRLFRARLALRNELRGYFNGQEVVL